MNDNTLLALADRIEAALTIDEALASDVLRQIGAFDAAHAADFTGPDLDSTDRLLMLVYDALPGWTVSVKGKAWQPNGHWVCSLRKTSSRDSDEYIGVGRAPSLPHALLAAVLRVIGQRRT